MTGQLDEVSTQWEATDPANSDQFKRYVEAVIKSDYEMLDEDGTSPLINEFGRLYQFFGGADGGDDDDDRPLPKLAQRSKSGRLLWPDWCHALAAKYRGPHTDYINWAWVDANFSEPKECVSMFRDPRVVSNSFLILSYPLHSK